MNFLIFIGLSVMLYTMIQYLIMRNKLEVERLEFIIFLVPLIVSVKDYIEGKPSVIEWIISLIVSYVIMISFVFIFIKIAGLPMQTNCDFDLVKRFFDKDKSFSKNKKNKSDVVIEYTDINDDILKISRRNRRITNITIKGNMKTIWILRKTIITKLSKMDKGISNNYYINGLVGGAILIIIGVIVNMFF